MVFSHELLHWYEANGRILPWRETKDPYIIWLSEIILQQTKVVQGLPYFHQFIKTFPTMESLAEASEEEVLKLWQGLGYYSRARNLHKTAKYIQSEYHGIFPDTYSLISKLPGIGDYTACAILSFAFGKVYPVLDGNVGRVSTRFSGIFDPIENQTTKNKIKSILQLWIDKDKPALFNQAIMDFGALVCTP
ncbi:MAG: A/G-specific adenine glycosylase, partial [Bacteroidales bacterium]